MTARAAVLLLGLVARTVLAQGRPDEDALFGAPADAGTPTPALPSQPLIPSAGQPLDRNTPAGEQQILTAAPAQDAFTAGLVKEDALKIGGQFYMRAISTISQNQPFGKSSFNVPTLLDVYLDARPTDRLRAFVLGRLEYDPLLSSYTFLTGVSVPGLEQPSNPAVYLDQAWLAFDIARTAFVTAGVQHVKWGTGQYFNPDDFLASQPVDPLAIFDARLGVSMLRVQIPWEKTGLSFTAVAVFQPTQNVSTTGTTLTGGGGNSVNLVSGNQSNSNGFLEDVGGAAQVEWDFKGGALGVNGLAQKYRAWRVGAYTTAGLGDFDVYGEAVLKQCLDLPYGTPNTTCGPSYSTGIVAPGTYSGYTFGTVQQPALPVFQAVGGLSYAINFEGNKSITLAGEYFYNRGSFAAKQYPNLLLQGAYQPFYLGRNYLALSATLTDTTAKTTWVLTTIGNLTDVSAITRLDLIVTVLSYLQVEAFGAVDYGHLGGEFRLGVDIPNVTFNTGLSPPNNQKAVDFTINAPIVQFGLGLRMAL
ncbi:MAG: hypothetical protein ACLQDQ_12690 [Myxococcaceae bacterium]